MRGNVLKQAKHRRHFALGQEIDLQIEVRALVRLVRQAVLARQDEQREEDRLEGDGHRQEWEREVIER